MHHLLSKYEDEEKLNRILLKFYSRVTSNVSIKHFFMDLSFEKMLRDVSRFNQFILDRPEKTYTDKPNQTTDPSLQIGSASFIEICHQLVEVLKEENIEEKDIPRLVTDTMEIIEESKSEASDRISSVYQVDNLNADQLIHIFSLARIKAELNDDNILTIRVNDTKIPIYLKLHKEQQLLLFYGKVVSKKSDCSALDNLVSIANEIYPFFPVFSCKENESFYLYAEHQFSIQDGLPSRLMNRIAKQFAKCFENAVLCDKEKILEF